MLLFSQLYLFFRYQTQIVTPGPPENEIGNMPRSQHIFYLDAGHNVWNTFSTLRMEWTPTELAFYFDGNLVRKETNVTEYAQLLDPAKASPMNVRATLWAGFTNWSGIVDEMHPPTNVTVDYISYESWDECTESFVPGWKDEFDYFNNSRWEKADWTFYFSVTDFSPNNVQVEGGDLVINFSRSNSVKI